MKLTQLLGLGLAGLILFGYGCLTKTLLKSYPCQIRGAVRYEGVTPRCYVDVLYRDEKGVSVSETVRVTEREWLRFRNRAEACFVPAIPRLEECQD